MPRFAYVNGRYVRHQDALVHVEDRGYQFADGVYEVCAVMNGALLDEKGHMARLERSLSELGIAAPVPIKSLKLIARELLRKNRVADGMLYIQISRGVAPRDHAFPKKRLKPAFVMTVKSISWDRVNRAAEQGIAMISMPDERWARCDIKSTALLANVLAKQKARDAGGYEAMLVDENGHVTEGSSSTIFILGKDGVLVTRPLGPDILPGITRQGVIARATEQGIKVEERLFDVEEAKAAREVFITAATAFVLPVVQIDDSPIGNGVPGSVSQALRAAYIEAARRETSC